jgi:hypothetical protein
MLTGEVRRNGRNVAPSFPVVTEVGHWISHDVDITVSRRLLVLAFSPPRSCLEPRCPRKLEAPHTSHDAVGLHQVM